MRRRPRLSPLSRNIAYNLAGQGALLLLGLITVRFVFRRLGPESFGIILFAQTLGLLLSTTLDLGIASVTVREVAAHETEDPAYVRHLLKTAGSIYWASYLVLVIGSVLLAPLVVTSWLNLGALDHARAARLIQILLAGTLLLLPRALYASLCRGLQRMVFNNVIEVGGLVVQQLGMVGILAAGGDTVAVASWFSGTYALTVAAYLMVGARLIGWQTMLPGFEASVIARNWRFAGHMASIGITGMAVTQVDKVAVSKLMPLSALGPYSFAATVVAGGSRVTYAIVQAAFPAFAELHEAGQVDQLRSQMRKIHALVIYITAPLFAALSFAALPLFSYVFGGGIAHQLVVPVALLCVGSYLNATLGVPYYVSIAVGRPEIASGQNLLALAIVVPVTALATLRFGLTGASFSWVLYHLVAYAYGLPRMCRLAMGVSLWSWLRRLVAPMSLVGLSYGIALFLSLAVLGGSLSMLIAGYVAASVVFFGAGYRLLGSDLRAAVRSSMRAFGAPLAKAA